MQVFFQSNKPYPSTQRIGVKMLLFFLEQKPSYLLHELARGLHGLFEFSHPLFYVIRDYLAFYPVRRTKHQENSEDFGNRFLLFFSGCLLGSGAYRQQVYVVLFYFQFHIHRWVYREGEGYAQWGLFAQFSRRGEANGDVSSDPRGNELHNKTPDVLLREQRRRGLIRLANPNLNYFLIFRNASTAFFQMLLLLFPTARFYPFAVAYFNHDTKMRVHGTTANRVVQKEILAAAGIFPR